MNLNIISQKNTSDNTPPGVDVTQKAGDLKSTSFSKMFSEKFKGMVGLYNSATLASKKLIPTTNRWKKILLVSAAGIGVLATLGLIFKQKNIPHSPTSESGSQSNNLINPDPTTSNKIIVSSDHVTPPQDDVIPPQTETIFSKSQNVIPSDIRTTPPANSEIRNISELNKKNISEPNKQFIETNTLEFLTDKIKDHSSKKTEEHSASSNNAYYTYPIGIIGTCVALFALIKGCGKKEQDGGKLFRKIKLDEEDYIEDYINKTLQSVSTNDNKVPNNPVPSKTTTGKVPQKNKILAPPKKTINKIPKKTNNSVPPKKTIGEVPQKNKNLLTKNIPARPVKKNGETPLPPEIKNLHDCLNHALNDHSIHEEYTKLEQKIEEQETLFKNLSEKQNELDTIIQHYTKGLSLEGSIDPEENELIKNAYSETSYNMSEYKKMINDLKLYFEAMIKIGKEKALKNSKKIYDKGSIKSNAIDMENIESNNLLIFSNENNKEIISNIKIKISYLKKIRIKLIEIEDDIKLLNQETQKTDINTNENNININTSNNTNLDKNENNQNNQISIMKTDDN